MFDSDYSDAFATAELKTVNTSVSLPFHSNWLPRVLDNAPGWNACNKHWIVITTDKLLSRRPLPFSCSRGGDATGHDPNSCSVSCLTLISSRHSSRPSSEQATYQYHCHLHCDWCSFPTGWDDDPGWIMIATEKNVAS